MSFESKRDSRLIDLDQVVQGYLATLLSEVETQAQGGGAPDISSSDGRADSQAASTRADDFSPAMGQVTAPGFAGAGMDPGRDQRRGSPAPDWAAHRFQSLLFDVNGITLAVPLLSLSGILKWSGAYSVLPGQPDWHLGVIVHHGEKVGIVDTARIVMPERSTGADPGQLPLGGHLLLVGDGRWGLRCDSLAGALELDRTDVRWRSREGKRPCLAGTIVDRLCMLLDVGAILREIRHK